MLWDLRDAGSRASTLTARYVAMPDHLDNDRNVDWQLGPSSRQLRRSWRARAGRCSTSTDRHWAISPPSEEMEALGSTPFARSSPKVVCGPTSFVVHRRVRIFGAIPASLFTRFPQRTLTTSSSSGVMPSESSHLKAAIVSAALPTTVGADEEDLFQLHIDRVLIASYTHRGQWPPSYQRWASPGG